MNIFYATFGDILIKFISEKLMNLKLKDLNILIQLIRILL